MTHIPMILSICPGCVCVGRFICYPHVSWLSVNIDNVISAEKISFPCFFSLSVVMTRYLFYDLNDVTM